MTDELRMLAIEQLKDLHSAERQALRCMQKTLKSASTPALRDGIQRHIEQSETQLERVEQGLDMLSSRPGRKVCEAMRGLVEEAQSSLEDHEKGPVMDLVIIAGMQRIEHYEIAAYGTMAAYAKAMGQTELAALLAETLAEEKATDEKLTEIAEGDVLPAALADASDADADEEMSEVVAPPARRRAATTRR
jgi:ferritin-like metal-binding protein YciE